MKLIAAAFRFLMGTGGLPEQFRRAYEAKLEASNDAERIAAEREVTRVTAAIEAMRVAAADRWGATSLGRYLIVIPFGVWWAAIFADSIFAFAWNVLAIPPEIMAMAKVLIPAIVLADAGALTARRFSR